MRKRIPSSALLVLLLSGCFDDDTIVATPDPQFPEDEPPAARVAFTPSQNDINLPNDLLMVPAGDLFDFTINTENPAAFDQANPLDALGATDGWSPNFPISIRVDLPEGLDIDPASISASAIRLFEAEQALEGTDPACVAIAAEFQAPGVPCVLGDELTFGQDFITSYTPGSGAISLIPLNPLKASQGHLLVVTEDLKSTDGRAVKGSFTWELVRQDRETNPLGVEALIPLQQIVNAMIDVLEPVGLTRDDVSYGAYFTTQSIGDVIGTVKQLQIAPFAQALQGALEGGMDPLTAQQFAGAFLPGIATSLPDSQGNAYELLAPLLFTAEELAQFDAIGLGTCEGIIAEASNPSSPVFAAASELFPVAVPFCAGTRVLGSLKLPYYSDPTDVQNDYWTAACTNGAMLSSLGAETIGSLVQAGQTGPYNGLCQAASGGLLFDLDLSSLGIDDPRFLTRYSPIPVPKGRNMDDPATAYNEAGTEDIVVEFSVPNEAVIAALSAATGGAVAPVTKPEGGWPVVVFQHGLTGSKENALTMAAVMSLAGFATASIDHTLHGDRGLTTPDGQFLNATLNGSGDFFSGGLLTSRDRGRQSAVDIIGFRLALNAVADTTGLVDLDLSKVHFIGQSLGAIAGTLAVSKANETLGGDLAAFDSMFAFNTAVINVPAAGGATATFASNDFGPFFRSSVLLVGLPAFAEFAATFAEENGLPLIAAQIPALEAFLASADAATLAEVESILTEYAFASQTIQGASDPINYGELLGTNTPTIVQLVVGGGTNDDGSTALTDQTNAVETPLPLAGGQALANVIGLEQISQTSMGGGVIRFLTGNHRSLLDPAASQATTTEMQRQAASFFASDGESVVISDEAIIEN